MKVSLNRVKKFTPVDLSTDELMKLIGSRLGEIEGHEDLSKKYDGATIARIVSCRKHPGADNLNICVIDDGGVNKTAHRDLHGRIEVVCGAPNVAENQVVVWLPPKSTLPSSYPKNTIQIGAKEIRGVISQGMLASARELDFSDDHDGILVIHDEIKIGNSLIDACELNDIIIDIENKMLTHRPDCFGQLGIAREIAGITHKPFKSPDWYLQKPQAGDNDQSTGAMRVEIKNEIPELVPRFMINVIAGVSIKPSSIKLQSYLSRLGIRPINNVVDQTNYMMMMTGQPLHAFDYDKVKALSKGDYPTLIIRKPKPEEKIKLLNGKEVTPSGDTILVAVESQAIGMAGIMGGAETEIDDNTKNIILECATFDMYSIRRASMANGIFSEAVTRFTKGQSPLQTDRIISKSSKSITKVAGGQLISVNESESRLPTVKNLEISVDFINHKLGSNLSAKEISDLLKNVEFGINSNNSIISITVPFWRTDIDIPEDIVEEVGRLYGYDNLKQTLPKRSISPVAKNKLYELKNSIRQSLEKAGANELLTYSFVHGQLLENVGQDPKKAFQLSNALSPDLQYYRLSLAPSLLAKVHSNIKEGYAEFTIFEMNKVHQKSKIDKEDKSLPGEINALALACAAKDKLANEYGGSAYYQIKYYLTYLLDDLGIEFSISPLANESSPTSELVKPFEPLRSALVESKGKIIAIIGEPKKSVRKALKLPDFVAMAEVDLDEVLALIKNIKYEQLSHYPKVEQDITLKVAAKLNYQELYKYIANVLATHTDLSNVLKPMNIFQHENDPDHKQITFRLTACSYTKTLKSSEVSELLTEVAKKTNEKFQAELIG